MAILEIILVLGLIAGSTAIVLKAMHDRKELKLLREERAARLEAAQTAKDVAQELLLDEELARGVQRHLNEALRHDCLPPKSK